MLNITPYWSQGDLLFYKSDFFFLSTEYLHFAKTEGGREENTDFKILAHILQL